MGKVIKVIDLLNMIAKGEELPKKIKIYGEEFSLEENSKCYSYYDWNMRIKHFLFACLNNESLNDKVEILDEEQEIDIQSIEEIDVVGCNIKVGDRIIPTENEINDYNIIKINQLVQAVKQLDLRLNKLESNT